MWISLQHLRSCFRGFTAVELLIVIAVVTMLTAVFLLQQRQFDSSTILRSLAYRTALSIREAQTYGVSVRFAGGATPAPAPAYGIYIASDAPTQYILFADYDNDRQYDTGEAVEVFTLRNGYAISRVCAKPTTASEKCSTDNNINALAILFVRPSTDACIATSDNIGTCRAGVGGEDYATSSIRIRAPGGATRSITVTNTGQISVGEPGT